MQQYSIGVTGEIQPGFDPSDVLQRLATLFKCSPEKAQRLISGKPVLLKTGLDQQSGERYRQQLLKTGVVPAIKKLPTAEDAYSTTPKLKGATTSTTPPVEAPIRLAPAKNQHSGSASRQNNDATMECPKCGTRQPRAETCAYCGIIVAKFRDIGHTGDRDQQSSCDPSVEMEDLGTFVGENFSAYHFKFQELIDNRGKYLFHWHWPAFLIAFPWLLYRKMYLYAILLAFLELIPVPFLGLFMSILCGALGNYLYFHHCRRKLAALGSTGADRYRAIALTGGTLSIPATILASILVSVLVSYAGYQLVFKDQLNHLRNNDQPAAISQAKGEAENRTLGRMMAIGEALRFYIAAEKMAGKQTAPPESMEDIQRTFKLNATDVSDEWGTQLEFVQYEGKSLLLSAGPDREFSTQDDLTYEVRFSIGE